MSTFDRNWRELQLETLVDLSLSIGGVRPEEEVVEELLQRAVGTLDARAGTVATLHPGWREGVIRSVGLQPNLEALRRLLGDALAKLADGGPLRLQPEAGLEVAELIAVPMLADGALIGAVVLADKEARSGRIEFTESDLRFLSSLATLGAAAVSTSRRVAAIERERQRLADENLALRDVPGRQGFVGESAPVREMLELVRRAAPTGANIMLRGESGVGKERVARLVHSLSDRAEGPFVPLNCAALPESLLEAELFGIEAGVATGVTSRLGKVELAVGGTLFLDEVGDLTMALQAKLLRVVQEREVERLGGRERIPVDIRLVTATYRDLEGMIAEGRFRRDLYYRLRVVVVPLPPLRARRTDIPLLARHFLDLYGERFAKPGIRLSHEAMAALMAYPFPGNIRELENLIQAAVALAADDMITEAGLGLPAWAGADRESTTADSLEELEHRHIERVLQSVDGNRGAAARILGIDRSTLYRKLKRFALYDAKRDSSQDQK